MFNTKRIEKLEMALNEMSSRVAELEKENKRIKDCMEAEEGFSMQRLYDEVFGFKSQRKINYRSKKIDRIMEYLGLEEVTKNAVPEQKVLVKKAEQEASK